ncbi:MAG: hypothetical protein QQW96_07370 [Tychonema bourrellyi B0820]|nr:hypothetical protein [Tychonema bourrellyi B0820]
MTNSKKCLNVWTFIFRFARSVEMGRWGDGEMGRWGEGERGRKREMGRKRRKREKEGDGERGEMGRGGEGESEGGLKSLKIHRSGGSGDRAISPSPPLLISPSNENETALEGDGEMGAHQHHQKFG